MHFKIIFQGNSYTPGTLLTRVPQVTLMVKSPSVNAEDIRDGLGRSWRRTWNFTPIFLPGEALGQRSLANYGYIGLQRLRHD